MTFIPLFSSIRSFLPHAVRSRCQCSRRPVSRAPYKDTTKWQKNKVFRVKQACAQGCSFPSLPPAVAFPGRKPSQSAPIGRVQLPQRGRWHRAAMTERVSSPPAHKKCPRRACCSSPGASYLRYALAHTTGIYSISIRFGFSGRAFVCCGAGSWMCRTPSSNFAWMSSFFTSPT